MTLRVRIAAQWRAGDEMPTQQEPVSGCSCFSADIKEVLSSGLSLMPEGLESAINHQETADLIAFLQAAIPVTGKLSNPNLERDFGTLPGLIESGEKR